MTAGAGATYSLAGAGDVSVTVGSDAEYPITGARAAEVTARTGATYSYAGACRWRHARMPHDRSLELVLQTRRQVLEQHIHSEVQAPRR